jgi:hypothetical protein
LGFDDGVSVFQLTPENYLAALKASGRKYELYQKARDVAEFAAAGRQVAESEPPLVYIARMIEAKYKVDQDVASAFVEDMCRIMGKAFVVKHATNVQQAPKNTAGHLQSPKALMLLEARYDSNNPVPREFTVTHNASPVASFETLLGTGDDRQMAILWMTDTEPRPSVKSPWSKGLETYNGHCAKLGKDKVHAIARLVRDATKRPNGEFLNPADAGGHQLPDFAFHGLLKAAYREKGGPSAAEGAEKDLLGDLWGGSSGGAKPKAKPKAR